MADTFLDKAGETPVLVLSGTHTVQIVECMLQS